MTPRRRPADRLVRPYVVTDGRAFPTRNTLDLLTMVVTGEDLPLTGLGPEKRGMVELCRPGALSVAEIAGHLSLPVSVTKVLVADLMDSGHLVIRAPFAPTDQSSYLRILEEVLDGLRARL